ncbi:g11673 [Coccomyxa viridis]|uniref:G11673 protein n=1 Tax=Coccomyxa viridis TaxID=1274662 RepID=A0ABP1GCM8_9CHLO
MLCSQFKQGRFGIVKVTPTAHDWRTICIAHILQRPCWAKTGHHTRESRAEYKTRCESCSTSNAQLNGEPPGVPTQRGGG